MGRYRHYFNLIVVLIACTFIGVSIFSVTSRLPRKDMDDKFMQWMWEHPPRGISSLACSITKERIVELASKSGTHCTLFDLRCQCGNTEFQVHHLVTYENERRYDVSPITVICDKCSKETVIFDSELHGSDAETGAFPYKHEGSKTTFISPKCGKSSFRISVMLAYSIDPKEMREVLNDKEYKRRQDFFDWITICLTCCSCGEYNEELNYECA